MEAEQDGKRDLPVQNIELETRIFNRKKSESVKISEEEWERAKAGIEEIEKGKFTTFEELKRDFIKKKTI